MNNMKQIVGVAVLSIGTLFLLYAFQTSEEEDIVYSAAAGAFLFLAGRSLAIFGIK